MPCTIVHCKFEFSLITHSPQTASSVRSNTRPFRFPMWPTECIRMRCDAFRMNPMSSIGIQFSTCKFVRLKTGIHFAALRMTLECSMCTFECILLSWLTSLQCKFECTPFVLYSTQVMLLLTVTWSFFCVFAVTSIYEALVPVAFRPLVILIHSPHYSCPRWL
jgi:hypothetical protein